MKRFLKILGVVVFLLVVLFVATTIFINIYFSKERIRELIIPKAEKLLARNVDFSDVSVGLFSGVSLKGFVVKDEDGKTDFIKVKELDLKFKLLPLLSKKLVITSLEFINPYIRIVRRLDGHFNYETLGFLEKGKEDPPGDPQGSSGSAALALTIKHIYVKRARIVFEDMIKQFPNADALIDLSSSLSLESGKLRFRGKSMGDVTFSYNGLKAKMKEDISFSDKEINYKLVFSYRKDRATVYGKIENYLARPLNIRATLNVYSSLLYIDRFQRFFKKVSERAPSFGKGKRTAKAKSAGGVAVPMWLDLSGVVKIDNLHYKSLLYAKNVNASYSFRRGVFELSHLSMEIADGKLEASVKALLVQKPFVISGSINVSKIHLEELFKNFIPIRDRLWGIASLNASFSAKGNILNAQGTYSALRVGIKQTPLTLAVVRAFRLKELEHLEFDNATGNFRIENNRLRLKTVFTGKQLVFKAKGYVGLDGSLDLPAVIEFSPEVSKRLVKKISYARYLENEKGWIVVPVKIGGTFGRPIVVPQVKSLLKRRIRGTIEKKLEKTLERMLK